MSGIENYMLPCFSKQLFGIDCPGCGGQRAVMYLFQGDLIMAFKLYPAIFLLIPLAIFVGINYFKKSKKIMKAINVLALSSVLTIVINYILKFL